MMTAGALLRAAGRSLSSNKSTGLAVAVQQVRLFRFSTRAARGSGDAPEREIFCVTRSPFSGSARPTGFVPRVLKRATLGAGDATRRLGGTMCGTCVAQQKSCHSRRRVPNASRHPGFYSFSRALTKLKSLTKRKSRHLASSPFQTAARVRQQSRRVPVRCDDRFHPHRLRGTPHRPPGPVRGDERNGNRRDVHAGVPDAPAGNSQRCAV